LFIEFRMPEGAMTVIAITREIGSLGTEVAAGVAKRLGLEIIRSEVASKNVARRLGVAESSVTRYLDGSASLLERWQIDRHKLFHYASEEILGLAQRGNVLIKGWGAATTLRDVPQVISARVCAPMEFRVCVMMERQGRNDAATVREEIERFDAARARALRAYFNVEQEDARLYHIVLNTERLSVDACVDAVCELAEGPRFRNTFTSRSALTNKLLEAKISSALVEHISVAMAPLGVSVSVANGRVTLAGTTCSGRLRKLAEKITHMVPGVLQIDNRIVSVPTRGTVFSNTKDRVAQDRPSCVPAPGGRIETDSATKLIAIPVGLKRQQRADARRMEGRENRRRMYEALNDDRRAK
jgi:cytidylate kinase